MHEQRNSKDHIQTGAAAPLVAELEQALGACDPRVREWWQQALLQLRATAPAAYGWLGGELAGPLPAGYADAATAEEAARDLVELHRLSRRQEDRASGDAGSDHGGSPLGAERAHTVGVSVQPAVDGGLWRVVFHALGESVALDRSSAALASVGLSPKAHSAHRIVVGGVAWWVDDYRVRPLAAANPRDAGLPLRATRALEALLAGRSDPDTLNLLVLTAGLEWEDVLVLRSYSRYRSQLGGEGADAELISETLTRHGASAVSLVDIFKERFDPKRDGDHGAADAAFAAALDDVARLDDDRVLRALHVLVDATVRTNRYTDGFAATSTLAIKLDGAQLSPVSDDVAAIETFVFGPSVEGVHLRAGPVARGGLRWSDRHDFRAEVYQLTRAQVLKNATIAPTGAKGGFRLRNVAGAGERDEAVTAAYRAFIGALIDVTDDVAGGAVVPPQGVVRHDGDDPYLVVAADKGTAALSDVANAIAEERGFWLGDAFASGGRNGFDHKRLGVTARGAWAACQEHLDRVGLDPKEAPLTMVGVGDMSGDVFGNFLLLSENMKLVAAFDHRHVFVDPDPDPELAYRERQRLATLSRSSWADYAPALISPGGGVWPRDAKSIVLAEEARVVLGLDDASVTGPELVRAVLRAPADVLFFGGIGTYVKAGNEDDAAAGVPVNSHARVDAGQLRARVVVEGANLGLTQAARIEYARNGGAINIDALDNAAGVETSDREVNLKIVLDAAVRTGHLDPAERDDLVRQAAPEVVEIVGRNVRQRAALVTREAESGSAGLAGHRLLLRLLELPGAAPRLDRRREALPDDAELERRSVEGRGLTRPEVAVLASYAATNLRQLLAPTAPHRNPLWAGVLCDYLPAALADRFCAFLHEDHVRPEVAAAVGAVAAVNDIIGRLGIVYSHDLADELGVSPVAVLNSYGIARQVIDENRGHQHGDGTAPMPVWRVAWLTRDNLLRPVAPDQVVDLVAGQRATADAMAAVGGLAEGGDNGGPLDPLGLTARVADVAGRAGVAGSRLVGPLLDLNDTAPGYVAAYLDRLMAPDRVTEVHRRTLLDQVRTLSVQAATTAVVAEAPVGDVVGDRFRFDDELADDPMHRLHQLAIAVAGLQEKVRMAG